MAAPDLPTHCPLAEWSYECGCSESKIVIADFKKFEKKTLHLGELPSNLRQYILELMQRPDLTLKCRNIFGMTTDTVYNAIENDIANDPQDFYDTLKVFKKAVSPDGNVVWKESVSVFAKYGDFVQFSRDIASTGKGAIQCQERAEDGKTVLKEYKLGSEDSAIYLLDLDATKSHKIGKELKQNLKLDGFLPGREWCATHYVSNLFWLVHSCFCDDSLQAHMFVTHLSHRLPTAAEREQVS